MFNLKIKTSADDKAALEAWLKTLTGKDQEKASAHYSRMKAGKFTLMLGAFCPFFWLSLLLGQSRDTVLFNLVHSLLFIVLGYFIFNQARKALYQMKASSEHIAEDDKNSA